MASNPEIVVKYRSDTSGLNKGLKGVQKSGAGIGKAMKASGLVAAAGLAAVAAAAVKTVKAASDLNESVNAVNVTFGKSAKTVHAFANVAAREAGLSMKEFNELVTPVGASLQNFGYSAEEAAKTSIDLTKRAADMASVFNTSVPEALEAIQAGLRGESDPLERFGVGLNEAAVKAKAMQMGLAGSEQALTAQDKAMARVALTMQQTDRLAGDFKNTSDGLANAQRVIAAEWENIQAKVGQALLPSLAAAASGVADFLAKFTEAKTMGDRFQLVIDTVKRLVGDLANAVADAVKRIDFGQLGRTLASGGEKIARDLGSAFAAAMRAVNWEAVGRGAATATIKGMATVVTLVRSVNWYNVGASVANGIIRAISGANWGGVMRGVIAVLVGVMRAAGGLFFGATTVWVNLILKGLAAGGASMRSMLAATMKGLVGIIRNAGAAFIAAAYSIGVQIIQGMINGIMSMAGALASRAASVVTGAKDAAMKALHMKSPSLVWAELGKDTIRGYILGITSEAPNLNAKTAEAMQKTLDATRAVIERNQSRFQTAFGVLGGYLSQAFSAKQGAAQTPAERQLERLQAARDEASRQQALADAQAQAAAATSDEERLAAQKALADAAYQIQVAALQAQAETERKHLEGQQYVEQQAFQNRLAALEKYLGSAHATAAGARKRIASLRKQFGIDVGDMGAMLGEGFAKGLARSQNQVVDAATDLANAVKRALRNVFGIHSPSTWARDEIGLNLARGIAAGLGRGAGIVNDALAASVPSMGSLSVAAAAPSVRVYIGDTELRGIVRTEVSASDTALARTLLAGTRA